MIRDRGTIRRVFKVISSGVLAQALTGTWTNGDSLQIEACTDFSPSGGDGFFEPGTAREEAFSYMSCEVNASDNPSTPDLLLGVIRSNPVAHAKGTFVQEGATETVEKQVDIEVDGEILTGIPVDPLAYTLFKLGTFTEDEMPVVPVEFDEDGTARVTSGAVGAIPVVGSDIETLPGTGDGDGTVDPGTGNPPPGQGWEDGAPPAAAPVITAVGGVGFISVRLVTVENGSAVTYKVHCHTTTGFTPADNTLVGTIRLAGIPDYLAQITVKDFSTGHVLDGTASDPVKAGTTYYFKAIPADGSGDGPTSAQVSASPVLIQSVDIGAAVIDLATHVTGLLPNVNLSQITDPAKLADAIVTGAKIAAGTIDASSKLVAGTIVGNLIAADAIAATHLAAGSVVAGKIAANAVTATTIAADAITSDKIAANSIVAGDIAAGTITGDKIAATTITADKLSVSTLSAISANIGTVTAGSIAGITITGGTIRTSASNPRVELTDGFSDRVTFYNAAGESAHLAKGTDGIFCSGDFNINFGKRLVVDSIVAPSLARPEFPDGLLVAAADAKVDGILIGNMTGDPPTGYVRLYKDANNLMAKAPGRAAVVVVAL